MKKHKVKKSMRHGEEREIGVRPVKTVKQAKFRKMKERNRGRHK